MTNHWKDVTHFVLRGIVSTHFVYELVDKCIRFDHWKGVISSQSGLGTWSLVLVIMLLLIGVVLILCNKHLAVAALSLAIFQIPTSIMFEQSGYEQADSASALGGVFELVFISAMRHPQSENRNLGEDLPKEHIHFRQLSS